MKINKINILLAVIFITGLSVMLYPSVSNYWNSRTQTKAVATYNEQVETLPEPDYESILAGAREYNEKLALQESPLIYPELVEGYEDQLNISGNGIMGYVTIASLGIQLPIYHGTENTVLQIGAGHLEGTSLPVGGKGTHSVLSAHRGLPSARLFTELDQMEVGDIFTITVLDQVLTYQTDQILVVEPDDIQALAIDPEQDYCTLMTCTPYGVNSHRILVRGTRIETPDELALPQLLDHTHIGPMDRTQIATTIAGVVIAAAAAGTVTARRLTRGRKDREKKS